MTPNATIRETTCQTGHDGSLFARVWSPVDEPVQGCVTIIHGLGEHGGRYHCVAEAVAQDGWASFVPDMRGHGKSPGRRGHASSYLNLLLDIEAARLSALNFFPDVPQVLLGHSMGGNLVANYMLRHDEVANETPPPSGVVLSGPMFLPSNPPTRPQIFAAWATGYMIPWFTVKAPVDTSRLTKNPCTVKSLRDDPLVHNRISVYLATQLLAQGRYALDHANELTIPTLLMHGEDDPITSYRATESFALRAGDAVKFVAFPDMLHEIFHETNAEAVFDVLRSWLTERR